DKSAAPTPAIHRLANLVVRLRAARFGVIAAVRLRPSGSGETSRRSALGTPARGGGWSGRRGSNPRPTAWKAVTLPLSYSRLRARSLRLLALRRAGPLMRRRDLLRSSARSRLRRPQISLRRLAIRSSLRNVQATSERWWRGKDSNLRSR